MNPSSEPVRHHDLMEEQPESPISIAHIVHVLRRYSGAIVLTMISVALLYAIAALATYLFASTTRTTTIPFRLDFEGASEGVYPNGTRFSANEIVAAPILLYVYEANGLSRFLPFDTFSRSIVVLESNRELEKLANEYRARLSDARLSAVDRERVEKEFEQKIAAVSKQGYAINYVHSESPLPETLVRKVLTDTLNRWAHVAINEQHVLQIEASVLSPRVVTDPRIRQGDLIVGIQILRSRVWRVLSNLDRIRELPGATLAKTPDQLSLDEVGMRLEEMMRFRLEPLAASVRRSDLDDPQATLQFLNNQLAYDERQLKAARERAEAIRQTLAVYSREQRAFSAPDASPAAGSDGGTTTSPEPETVLPPMSETFLDRLVMLTSESVDSRYRQRLAEEYRFALQSAIPLEESVAYDRLIIAQLEGALPAGGGTRDARTVRAELATVQNDLRGLVEKVNELYQIASRNMFPTSQLTTVTAPPVSRVERSVNLRRLGLYGILLMLIAFPLSIVGALLHNRMKEEEAEESTALGHRQTEAAV